MHEKCPRTLVRLHAAVMEARVFKVRVWGFRALELGL